MNSTLYWLNSDELIDKLANENITNKYIDISDIRIPIVKQQNNLFSIAKMTRPTSYLSDTFQLFINRLQFFR